MRRPTISPTATPLAALLATRLAEALELHPTVKTQVQLSAAAGLAQSSISKILRGETDSSMGVLYSISNGLGIPLSLLVADTPVAASVIPRGSVDAELKGLGPLQRALIEVVLRAAQAGKLPDAECARLIGEWASRLEQRPIEQGLKPAQAFQPAASEN